MRETRLYPIYYAYHAPRTHVIYIMKSARKHAPSVVTIYRGRKPKITRGLKADIVRCLERYDKQLYSRYVSSPWRSL